MSIKIKQTAAVIEFKTKLVEKIKEDFGSNAELEKIIDTIESFGGKGKKTNSTGEKKPLSAYQQFVKDNLSKVRDDNPDIKGPDAMREVGRMWKEAKEEAGKAENSEKVEKVEKVEKGQKSKKKKVTDSEEEN
jgi:hypothetical protein